MLPLWATMGMANSLIAILLVWRSPWQRNSLLALSLALWGCYSTFPAYLTPLLLCTVLPLVEEIVFRGGLSSFLRRLQGSSFWASYASALVFAFAHSIFLPRGDLTLVVGPFLLGCCCELLRAWRGALWPGILLHGVLNFHALGPSPSLYFF